MRSAASRVAGLLAAALLAAAPPAVFVPSASAAPAPGAAKPGVVLLGQSPFVEAGQALHLQLQVTSATPTDRVEAVLGSRLTTRSGFDADVRFGVRPSPGDTNVDTAAGSLPADPAGGVDLNIPVDPATPAGSTAFSVPQDVSGVYPLTVGLVSASGQTRGSALTTFMVYAAPSAVAALAPGAASNGLPRLDVALNVPVRSAPEVGSQGQPARLTPDASSALAAEVSVLAAHPTVPFTLDPSPATLDSLAAGGVVDRSTLAQLQALSAGGHQVAEEPYASVSLPSLTAAGLGSEVSAQLQAGAQAVASDLGQPATTGTLVVNGPLDQDTLGDLSAAGINQLVVPSGDLSALPQSESQTTVASPADLYVRGPATAKVVDIDNGLQGDFAGGRNAALAATRVLAELSMIQLETPGEHRGMAVVPPAAWQANPTFLDTLLAGLSGNPLLNPVTTSGLFSLPLLGTTSPVTRYLSSSRPTVPSFPDPAQVRRARQAVDAVGSILPPTHGQGVALPRGLLLAESAQLPGATQHRLVAGVADSLSRLQQSIVLPSSSVTLTARDGDVPITVVAKSGAAGASVRLRLNSEKLTFRPFRPPVGTCSLPSSGVEECQLTLTSEATTLKVPVVARASGVFSLAVALSSPDGTVGLSQTRDTVRSTAFSGVGVLLMAVAGLALVYWWVRNIRHGRRATELIPPSEDETDQDDDRGGDDDVGGHDWRNGSGDGRHQPAPDRASWLDDDPVIADFFASPAPSYPPRREPPTSA